MEPLTATINGFTVPATRNATNFNNPQGTPTPAPQLPNNQSQVITSEALKPEPQVTIPVAPTVPQVAPTFTNEADRILRQSQVEDTEAQQLGNKLSERIFSSLQNLTGEQQALGEAQKEAGVGQFKQQLQDINSQILKKQAELQQDDIRLIQSVQNLEQQKIPMEFITGQQQSVQRDAQIARALKASEIGILNASALATQGNIALAMETAQQAVDLKYAPYKEEIALYKSQLEALAPILSRDEKKQAREQEIKANLALKDLDKRQKNDEALQNMLITASSQNAPMDLLNRAKNAKTPSEAAMILGQYAGDFYKTELLKQQILTEKSQKANYDANAQKTRVETGLLGQPLTTDGVIATLPKAAQERYYKLQGDFDAATKAYRGAIDSANSITALSKDATSQDQTAIIFQYMKTLDPTSTVREGEFALVAATAGLGDRAVNALKRLDDGQRLNESQIKDIVGATKKLAENAKQNLDATSKEFDRRAAKFGLPTGLFYEPQEMSPEVSAEADAIRKKLELANPALKKTTILGTDIIRLTPSGGFDFKIPPKQN